MARRCSSNSSSSSARPTAISRSRSPIRSARSQRHRVLHRLHEHLVRQSSSKTAAFDRGDRGPGARQHAGPSDRSSAQPRHGERGPGLRQLLLRRDGPILGQRYRLEVTPTLGSLNYVGVLADYGRYFMPVRPFTLARPAAALRPLRIGRRGPAAPAALPRLSRAGARLQRSARSTPPSASRRRARQRLPGVRPAAGQPHGRRQRRASVPAARRSRRRVRATMGRFPIDFIVFGDGGLAWDTRTSPSRRSATGKPVVQRRHGTSDEPVRLRRSASSTWSGRSTGRARDWVWELDLQQGF